MKKIIIMTLIAAAVLAAGCQRYEYRPETKTGELTLSVSCNSDDYVDKLLVKSSEGLNTDNFTVVITKLFDEWGEAADWTNTWTLGEFPSVLELAPGTFKIVVASPEAERTATDKPTFYVEKEFSIVENVVTPLELVCAITNMKVSLAPTANFFSELVRYTVTVSADYAGIAEKVSVSWTEADFTENAEGNMTTDKVAYIEPVPFTIMVTGNRRVDDSDASLKEPIKITDVTAKDHHILNIDVQVTGELDSQKSIIRIDTSLNDPEDVEVFVPGFEEIPIPDEPGEGENPEPEPEPEPQIPAPSLTWEANPQFETVHVTVDGALDRIMDMLIVCPGKIKSFVISPSENFEEAFKLVSGGFTELDLINNEALYEAFSDPSMYLPTGDALRGHEEVEFSLGNLAALIPVVAKTPGEQTVFYLYLEDEAGQVYEKAILFETVE